MRIPKFYSIRDEDVFVSWLKSISGVETVEGRGREFHIKFSRAPGDRALRELLAVFYRYRLNMKPLAAFRTERNAAWFSDNLTAYWHKKVFGKAERPSSG